MTINNYKKNKSEKIRPESKFTETRKESDYNAEREQINFSLRVENYMRRHPEFLDELQRRMDEDELSVNNHVGSNQSDNKSTDRQKENRYTNNKENTKGISDFAHLSESDMEKISGEISGLLFKKDESHKSFLEKKAEEAVSGMVYKYLSNFMR
jgi:hypothetical protein